MSDLTYEEQQSIIWSRRLERFSPILSFDDPEHRKTNYLVQASLLLTGGFVALPFLFTNPVTITLALVVGFAALGTFFVADAEWEPTTRQRELRSNLHAAAKDAFDKKGEIELADYISNHIPAFQRARDSKFIDSLTPRQMRWIQRAYKKEEKRILSEHTQHISSIEDRIRDKTATLNAAVDTESIRRTSYQFNAIKELEAESRKRRLTEEQQLEKEFSSLQV